MKEQRKEPRNVFIDMGKVCIVGPGDQVFYDCKLVNISNHGVSFYSDIKIGKDQLVKVVLDDRDFTCSIVWRRKVDDLDSGIYHYGMEIVGEIDAWSKGLLV